MSVSPIHVQPFVPIVWTTSLVTLAGKEGFITNHHALVSIIDVSCFQLKQVPCTKSVWINH